VQLKYERDLNGLVSRRTELVEGRDEFFHMDGHHRLKEWLLDYGKGGPGSGDQASIYTYNAIDNLKNVSVSGSAIAKYEELFTHGSNGKPHALFNRAKKADPQTFFYDGRGRLLDGDGQQYTYTSFDLPRSITTPAGTTQFKYDASGSRVQKQGPGGVTTSIRGLYESREGPGGLSYTFVVHTADGPVAEIVYKPAEPNPRTVHYRHHDALGSVSVTTSQGGPVARRYFEPFGGDVGFDGTPAATLTHDIRHGFTGHPHDDDLGLIDMRGRIYSPSTRQFLTPDPLGRLGASPYSYVSHNPLNWIDPTGFTEEDPGGAWFSDFDTLFGVVPSAAIDMSQTLLVQLAAVVAAMDFPNGNDAPNSSGCPDGTGTAPRPCAAPGQAGCTPPQQREPPTVRQAPLETVVDRILMLDEPPDEIGPYSIVYHIKHGIVAPIQRWVANEPNVYLDADHNVRTSRVQRDYSHEMAPVLGEITLMVAPGAIALTRGESIAARAGAEITKGSQVTEQTIREAMKGAQLSSQQSGGVSLPLIQRYVDKLLAGEVAPAIRVDGKIIVDGNHRYIAGRILGQEPAIQPWAGGSPSRVIPWDELLISPNAW